MVIATPFQFIAQIEFFLRHSWEADPVRSSMGLESRRRLILHQQRVVLQIGIATGRGLEPEWLGSIDCRLLPEYDGPPAFVCRLHDSKQGLTFEHLILIQPGTLESSAEWIVAQFLQHSALPSASATAG